MVVRQQHSNLRPRFHPIFATQLLLVTLEK
jgi:hypothetical protein